MRDILEALKQSLDIYFSLRTSSLSIISFIILGPETKDYVMIRAQNFIAEQCQRKISPLASKGPSLKCIGLTCLLADDDRYCHQRQASAERKDDKSSSILEHEKNGSLQGKYELSMAHSALNTFWLFRTVSVFQRNLIRSVRMATSAHLLKKDAFMSSQQD